MKILVQGRLKWEKEGAENPTVTRTYFVATRGLSLIHILTFILYNTIVSDIMNLILIKPMITLILISKCIGELKLPHEVFLIDTYWPVGELDLVNG